MPLQYPQRFYEQLHQPYSFFGYHQARKVTKGDNITSAIPVLGLELNEQKLSF